MDKTLLLDAVRALNELGSGGETCARDQAVRQYNVLLKQAKSLYPNRPDIGAMMFYDEEDEFGNAARAYSDEFEDAARRLQGPWDHTAIFSAMPKRPQAVPSLCAQPHE